MKLPAEFVEDGEVVEFPVGKDFSLSGWATILSLSLRGFVMAAVVAIFCMVAPLVHVVCFLKKQWNKLFNKLFEV